MKHDAPAPGPGPSSGRRILVVAFACPPIHVQMSPVTARVIAELAVAGYEVDVITASPNVYPLPMDEALVPYIERHTRRVVRLGKDGPPDRLRRTFKRMVNVPDPMIPVVRNARNEILARGKGAYAAVVTISPFHSVNRVMMGVKARFKDLPWIAFFGDPWAGNPLEFRRLIKLWHAIFEKAALKKADRVVHTSETALSQLLERHPRVDRARTSVAHHTFDSEMYPRREKASNGQAVIRFIGTLFGDRSPEPVFQALCLLLERGQVQASEIRVELVGHLHPTMLQTPAAMKLGDLVTTLEPVGYLSSLELMYDADMLLLIEWGAANRPFVPSKLTDYMGANTPILGIAPEGDCLRILDRLGAPTAAPGDVEGIAAGLMRLLDARRAGQHTRWCDEAYRSSFDLRRGARGIAKVVGEVAAAS